jgi:acyl-CoA synthetase (AMP-forming)/AMP-acid ligase II
VLGIPDDTYGELVAIVCAMSDDGPRLTLGEIISWGTERLTLHELPRDLRVVPALERNAMGKVNKKVLREQFSGGLLDR